MLIAGLIAIGLFCIPGPGIRAGGMDLRAGHGPLVYLPGRLRAWLPLSAAPVVLWAINPMYGINYLLHNGLAGFLILSSVILCATGGEALYADMGHLGRDPIVRAWYIVFVALVMNYLGQGAFLLTHPGARNILFEMVFSRVRHPLHPVPAS